MPLRRPNTKPADDDGYDNDEDDTPAPPKRGLRGARIEDDDANKAFQAGTREGSGYDEDDDDDEPVESVVKSGWAAAKKAKAESSTFTSDFTFPDREKGDEPVLGKFLSSEPLTYPQHWIDSGLSSTKKKSFVCMGKGCPLCKIGQKVETKFAFSLAVIDDEVTVKALVAGVKLLGQLEGVHSSKQDGPLDKHFRSLSSTGKNATKTYAITTVKARDLAEDWNLDLEEVEAELAKCKPITADAFKPLPKSQLQALARELAGLDD